MVFFIVNSLKTADVYAILMHEKECMKLEAAFSLNEKRKEEVSWNEFLAG